MMSRTSGFQNIDDAALTKEHWKWTVLSSIADYLDAGTIVAGGAALTIWLKSFHMHASLAGILGAFGANGIAAAVGALIAGYLGDKFGRKAIYTFDLLVYMLGALLVIFAFSPTVLIAGYIIMGLATGADVPTSWSLIAEYSPRKSRGKLMGLTNVFWYIGPIVILILALILSPLGLLGMRLLFVSLLIVAVITYFLRRSMVESPRWSALKGKMGDLQKTETAVTSAAEPEEKSQYFSKRTLKELLNRKNIGSLIFISALYCFWNIPAGTYGFFFPYLFETVGATSTVTADLMQMLWFVLGILGVLVIFMPFGDRVNRKVLYTISTVCCGLGFVILLFFPISNPVVAIANIVLFGFGQGIAIWPLQRVWSVELFPTEIRNTFQGISWFAMRMAIGLWSLFVPMAALGGLQGVAIVFSICFAINIVIALIWGPRTEGKSLEEITA